MKIYLDIVGCRLNQSEIETYARQFHAAGHTLVSSPEGADIAVINTCTVTAAAASDSRQKVRQAQRLGAAEVVVTGCWSTLEPRQAAALPGVSRVVPNQDKDSLVADLLGDPVEAFDLEPLARPQLTGTRPQLTGTRPQLTGIRPQLPVARLRLPGARLRTRAFIKVQDGCDNRCTFCITTLARGAGRSRPVADVLADIQAALDPQGDQAREVVLSGVHLGSWGGDFSPPRKLGHLLQAVLAETDAPRLRLSSLEPWDLDEDFLSLWQDLRLCRHLHLPLQSGSARTLRRMARKTTPASFAALLEAARRLIPGVAITTDLITGFPGESQAEFEESLAFVEAMGFAGGHVFTYSARPGTAAARMPGQVPHAAARERSVQLRQVLARSALAYQESFLGSVLPVLWESASSLGPEGWRLSGLTDNYLRVQAVTPQRLWNQVVPVRLVGWEQEGLLGEIL